MEFLVTIMESSKTDTEFSVPDPDFSFPDPNFPCQQIKKYAHFIFSGVHCYGVTVAFCIFAEMGTFHKDHRKL
jgi:hypothetical protein